MGQVFNATVSDTFHCYAIKIFCITFVQCWTNVEDVGPTLYNCYTNVLCFLGDRPTDGTRDANVAETFQYKGHQMKHVMQILLTHFTIRPQDFREIGQQMEHVMQMLLKFSLSGHQMDHVMKMLLTHFTIMTQDEPLDENVTDTFHY